ncbi:MAG: hypothetical protein M3Q34_02470 [bacterium]|nr:hypothetical protein [bacterium]
MSKLLSYLNHPRNLIIFLLVSGGVIFLIGTFFSRNEEYVNKQANENIEIESKSLVDKVSQLIYLPENEVPTIATVTDLRALKGQAFFADAKVGDKVLIYTQAKKAVLYNPKSNKIVTIAPLSTGEADPALQY